MEFVIFCLCSSLVLFLSERSMFVDYLTSQLREKASSD